MTEIILKHLQKFNDKNLDNLQRHHIMKKFLLATVCLTPIFTASGATPKFTTETILEIQRLSDSSNALHLPVEKQSVIPVYIRFSNASCIDDLTQLGITVDAVGKTVLTARVPVNMLEQVAAMESVECIQAAQTVVGCGSPGHKSQQDTRRN